MDSPNSSHPGERNSTPRYKRHGSRYKARRRAVDIIFEAEARDVDPVAICDERSSMACQPDSDVRPVNAYTRKIVEGVAVELNTVDEVIVNYLTDDWELGRIAATDRAILRVIVWEMLYSPDVPAKVAVVEATELASQYSDASSPAYINAMLDRMADDVDDIKARINRDRADEEGATTVDRPVEGEPEPVSGTGTAPADTAADSGDCSPHTGAGAETASTPETGECAGPDDAPAVHDSDGTGTPAPAAEGSDAPAGNSDSDSTPDSAAPAAEPEAESSRNPDQPSTRHSDCTDNEDNADSDNGTGATQVSNWVI
ncbi:transcription antitermination factor NusB [Corynebacterium mendelii]|uniref:Transcription antitermination protein NusB n=1 Tax=Corynebacterium mendelii TaxID=2765362 RepID=A0A939DYZ4_9CORY|nr:transcription antitermination factor NusB [Corynebacterium mendelii]MBN9643409.1 transcription antitermination factor NusB [Corynebacterium mendelii]